MLLGSEAGFKVTSRFRSTHFLFQGKLLGSDEHILGSRVYLMVFKYKFKVAYIYIRYTSRFRSTYFRFQGIFLGSEVHISGSKVYISGSKVHISRF